MPEARIDMNNLSERELLILINEKVSTLEDQFKDWDKDMSMLQLKVKEIETKLKMWAALIGGIVSTATTLIMELIKHI